VRLTAPARDVLVGNPAIADVTMLDTHNLAVVGKAYGATHLMVVDMAGRTIMDKQIIVAAPLEGQVSVYRGPRGGQGETSQQTLACADRCEQAARAAAR
jgi:Flp pilus assembly secretin CpaC